MELNEALKDEELRRILFAELLNQKGCNTGVDTMNMIEKWFAEHPGESLEGEELEQFKQELIQNMRCIPMPIELKEEPTERLDEPSYYAGNGLSPLEAFKKGLLSREETIGFIKGNIIKYVTRAGHKHNASEDMVKAIDYCGHLKRLYENEMRNGR